MYILVYLFVVALVILMLHSSNRNVKRVERMGGKGEFHRHVVSGDYKREREIQKAKLHKKKKRWRITDVSYNALS